MSEISSPKLSKADFTAALILFCVSPAVQGYTGRILPILSPPDDSLSITGLIISNVIPRLFTLPKNVNPSPDRSAFSAYGALNHVRFIIPVPSVTAVCVTLDPVRARNERTPRARVPLTQTASPSSTSQISRTSVLSSYPLGRYLSKSPTLNTPSLLKSPARFSPIPLR